MLQHSSESDASYNFFLYRYDPFVYSAFEQDVFHSLHGDFTARFSLMSVYSISAMKIIDKQYLKSLLIVYVIAGTTWIFVVMWKVLVRTGPIQKRSLWKTSEYEKIKSVRLSDKSYYLSTQRNYSQFDCIAMVICLHFNESKLSHKLELLMSGSCPRVFIAVSLLLQKISNVVATNHTLETISQPDTTIWIANFGILRNSIKVKKRIGIREG